MHLNLQANGRVRIIVRPDEGHEGVFLTAEQWAALPFRPDEADVDQLRVDLAAVRSGLDALDASRAPAPNLPWPAAELEGALRALAQAQLGAAPEMPVWVGRASKAIAGVVARLREVAPNHLADPPPSAGPPAKTDPAELLAIADLVAHTMSGLQGEIQARDWGESKKRVAEARTMLATIDARLDALKPLWLPGGGA